MFRALHVYTGDDVGIYIWSKNELEQEEKLKIKHYKAENMIRNWNEIIGGMCCESIRKIQDVF